MNLMENTQKKRRASGGMGIERIVGWAMLLGSLVVTAGCGGKQIPFDQGVVTGNWQVQFVADVTGVQRTGGGFLGQVGQNVNGAFVLAGPCAGTGNVSGTVDRQDVTLNLGQTGQKFALIAVLSQDSSTMSGTYSTTVTSGCTALPETGTWTAIQVQPVQGSFSTTFTSNHGAGTVHLTGTLTQQAKPNGGTLALVTGPLTSTDSACLVSPAGLPLMLNGTISGTEIAFSLDDSSAGSLGTFSGTASTDGKTITVADYSFVVPGSSPPIVCDAGNGTVTLH
jgi:hypothetical protein